MEWREQGGPPFKPATRKGFGRFVTDQMVTRALSASVKIDFASGGLRWALQMPASEARGTLLGADGGKVWTWELRSQR
jgi:two-component system, chemotaxis family, CheB/CheR fusion protein